MKTSGWGQAQNQAGGPTTPRIAHHAATRPSSHGASHTSQAAAARNKAFATCGAESSLPPSRRKTALTGRTASG